MSFDLDELSIDYSDFGLEIELDSFEGEYDEDNDIVEEPPKVPFSKQQDIWLLGRHRLMCGSSTEEEDVKMLMNGLTNQEIGKIMGVSNQRISEIRLKAKQKFLNYI